MDPSAQIDALARRQGEVLGDPLRALAADAAAKRGRLRGPVELTVEVTNDCIGGCVFCVQAGRREPRHMSVATFARLVEELADVDVARVILTGGEPSAHPRLLELVALGKRAGLALVVETDGSGWPPRALAGLAGLLEPRRDRLRVSVDALSDEVHASLRRTAPGSAWALIEAAVGEGVTVETHTIVLRRNQGELLALVDRLLGLGVARAIVTLPHGRELDPSLRPDARACLELFVALSERPRVRLSVAALARALVEAGLVDAAIAARLDGPCHAGRSTCFVSVDGQLRLCAQPSAAASSLSSLSSLIERPFAAAWAGLARRTAALVGDAAACPAGAAELVAPAALARGARA